LLERVPKPHQKHTWIKVNTMKLEPPTHEILGLPFFTGTVEKALEQVRQGALLVAPSGPNLANEWVRDPAYRHALCQAGVVLTDSAVMLAAYRLRTGQRLPRHSGLKFIDAFIRQSALRATGEVFWVMPSAEEGGAIANWLRNHGWPMGPENVYVAPHYPKGAISDELLLERLRMAKPRVIVLNLAGGKQEVLGAWLHERLGGAVGIVCTGAAIAFFAGTQAPIPYWADRAGLGWLFRCLFQPSKFVPRYWKALPLLPLVWRFRQQLPPMRNPA
jgi:N-acetylglucosaminyldiphosphoundecaprenol N-acetyl-beta-D-mannosaminyltransferase